MIDLRLEWESFGSLVARLWENGEPTGILYDISDWMPQTVLDKASEMMASFDDGPF